MVKNLAPLLLTLLCSCGPYNYPCTPAHGCIPHTLPKCPKKGSFEAQLRALEKNIKEGFFWEESPIKVPLRREQQTQSPLPLCQDH